MKYTTLESAVRGVLTGKRGAKDTVHRMRLIADKVKAKYPDDKEVHAMVDEIIANFGKPLKRSTEKGVSLTTALERVRKYQSEED